MDNPLKSTHRTVWFNERFKSEATISISWSPQKQLNDFQINVSEDRFSTRYSVRESSLDLVVLYSPTHDRLDEYPKRSNLVCRVKFFGEEEYCEQTVLLKLYDDETLSVEKELKCHLCLAMYCDATNSCIPRVLSCGHTFCSSCLSILFVTRRDSTAIEIKCPVDWITTKGDVDKMPLDTSVLDRIREKKILEKAIIQCYENEKHGAEVYCNQCKKEYCMECSKDIHSFRAFSNHRILPLQQRPFVIPNCVNHVNNKADIVCKDVTRNCMDECFCEDCAYGHPNCIPVMEHMESNKIELKDIIKDLKKYLGEAAAEINEIQDDLNPVNSILIETKLRASDGPYEQPEASRRLKTLNFRRERKLESLKQCQHQMVFSLKKCNHILWSYVDIHNIKELKVECFRAISSWLSEARPSEVLSPQSFTWMEAIRQPNEL